MKEIVGTVSKWGHGSHKTFAVGAAAPTALPFLIKLIIFTLISNVIKS